MLTGKFYSFLLSVGVFFLREADTMQQIRHENVVKYTDAWTDSQVNPKFFSIVMEFCDGGDLQVKSSALFYSKFLV